MINQLFLYTPDRNLIMKCINILGFENLNDKKELTKHKLLTLNISTRFQQLITELKQYYLPCKQKKYLVKWTIKSCITITRQLLKTIDYDIYTKEKMVDNIKIVCYKLITKTEKETIKRQRKKLKVGIITKSEPVIVNFN